MNILLLPEKAESVRYHSIKKALIFLGHAHLVNSLPYPIRQQLIIMAENEERALRIKTMIGENDIQRDVIVIDNSPVLKGFQTAAEAIDDLVITLKRIEAIKPLTDIRDNNNNRFKRKHYTINKFF